MLTFKNVSHYQSAEKKLLYLAEPEVQLVEAYLRTGQLFAAYAEDHCVAVLVTRPKSSTTLEIMNLAVQEEQQNQGIGAAFLRYIQDWAKQAGYQILEIATGSTTFPALALYQKVGFRFSEIVPDYFTDHYQEPLIEFGIRLRDQVRLQYPLN